MKVKVEKSLLSGKINAIVSKSSAHRISICNFLAGNNISNITGVKSQDIKATENCLNSLLEKNNQLNCGESGSTLRFLLPLCACLGGEYTFLGQGKLLSRPNEELFSVFSKHGVKSQKQQDRILISGKLTSGEYSIRGDISSQYISGLLMALPTLNGDSKIILTTPLVSKPYVDITLEVLRSYGIEIIVEENGFIVKGGQKYIGNILPEGDWSNCAFFLAGASVNGQVEILNLNKNSVQGDKKIVEILRSANANIKWVDDRLCVLGNKLKAFTFDAEDCPDIVPILAVVASFSLGTSLIKNIQRLKIKESDRIESTLSLLKSFGIKATCDGVNLTIYGGELTKETPIINSYNDHRIVMSASIMGVLSENGCIIENAEAVNKSYPNFFDDLIKLGGKVSEL